VVTGVIVENSTAGGNREGYGWPADVLRDGGVKKKSGHSKPRGPDEIQVGELWKPRYPGKDLTLKTLHQQEVTPKSIIVGGGGWVRAKCKRHTITSLAYDDGVDQNSKLWEEEEFFGLGPSLDGELPSLGKKTWGSSHIRSKRLVCRFLRIGVTLTRQEAV